MDTVCTEREDAEVMARRLFGVSGEEIKHTVGDETQQERTHPVYYSLAEQWEKRVQQMQELPARRALVKAPGRSPDLIRTITVRDGRCSADRLERIKTALARQSGRPVQEFAQATSGRVENVVFEREEEPVLREARSQTTVA